MDALTRSWFPELNRVEGREQRRLWRAAYWPVVRSLRYWVVGMTVGAVASTSGRLTGGFVARLADQGRYQRAFSTVGTAVGGGCAGLWILWLMRERISRNLRRELLKRGEPICLECGYDVRAQVETRCPECGTPFDPAAFTKP